ncbi:MAG: hypothetical protein J1E38_05670 [Paramuribaculum sp.]|nr:hypothetical protein [Paramuribaculum sp.]
MAVMITNPELLLEILPANNLICHISCWLVIIGVAIFFLYVLNLWNKKMKCQREKLELEKAKEAENKLEKMKEQYAEFIKKASLDLTEKLKDHNESMRCTNHFKISAEMHEAKITVEYGDRRLPENADDDNKRINVVILSDNDKITHKVRKIIDEA